MVSPKDMKLPIMGSQIIKERLPPQIEKLMRRQREITEAFFNGQGKDTRLSSLRYMAYTNRLQTITRASQHQWERVARAGAASKPLLSRAFLRCAFGLTGIYLVADLANEGMRAYHSNMRAVASLAKAHDDATGSVATQLQSTAIATPNLSTLDTETTNDAPPIPQRVPYKSDWRAVVAERAVFQLLSSLVLPAAALTVVVRHSTQALSDSGSAVVRRWGPLAIGLGIVPMLPYAFDEPVDRLVRGVFDPVYVRLEAAREAREAREAAEL